MCDGVTNFAYKAFSTGGGAEKCTTLPSFRPQYKDTLNLHRFVGKFHRFI